MSESLGLKNYPVSNYPLSILLTFRHFLRTCTIFDVLKPFNVLLQINFLS